MNHKYTIIFRFFWVMLLLMVVLIVVGFALDHFMSYELPGSTGIVVVLVPAMDAGQQFFKLENRRPVPRESWRYALIFVVINFVVGFALFAAIGLLGSLHMFASIGLPTLFAITAVLVAIYVAVARMFFAIGAKQQEKQSQSQ